MYFTIRLDQDGYRARLWSANHQLIWWTEGYVGKADAENAIRMAMGTNFQTPVSDYT